MKDASTEQHLDCGRGSVDKVLHCPLTNAERTLCSLRDGETTSFQEIVRNLPRRSYICLLGQSAARPEDFEEQVEADQISQDDNISVQDLAEEQNVPLMIPQNEELLTETPALPQPPPDAPGQQLNSQAPMF